jgi:hypothetical protein
MRKGGIVGGFFFDRALRLRISSLLAYQIGYMSLL